MLGEVLQRQFQRCSHRRAPLWPGARGLSEMRGWSEWCERGWSRRRGLLEWRVRMVPPYATPSRMRIRSRVTKVRAILYICIYVCMYVYCTDLGARKTCGGLTSGHNAAGMRLASAQITQARVWLVPNRLRVRPPASFLLGRAPRDRRLSARLPGRT